MTNGMIGLVGMSVVLSYWNREFFNTPAFTYNSTGYNIAITNVTGANNLPLFSQAVVTTPAGKQIVYKPVAGRSSLVLVNPTTNALTNTSVIRMASKYTTASTAGHPRDKEGSYLYFVDTDLTDAEFKALPDNGTWNIEFTLAATGAKVTQSHRTISRALTLGEASVFKLPNLTAAAKAAVITRSSVNGAVIFGVNENVNLDWEVPVGAAAPTSVTAYGRAPVKGQPSASGAQFDDSATVGSTARSGTVNCSTLNATDTHCATATSAFFATNATMSSLELFSLTPRFVELSKMNALYKLQ